MLDEREEFSTKFALLDELIFCVHMNTRLPHVWYDKLPQSNEEFSKWNYWGYYILSPMSVSLIEGHLKKLLLKNFTGGI